MEMRCEEGPVKTIVLIVLHCIKSHRDELILDTRADLEKARKWKRF